MSVSTPSGSSSRPDSPSVPPAAASGASVPSSTVAEADPQAAVPNAGGGQGDAADYAIVETGGQQFWLQPNRYLDIDRIAAEVDSTVTLDTVLLLKNGNGVTLGQPFISGARVELKVLAHRRGPKILVYKMRRKKKTRRKTGHRQELTRVLVQAIHAGL